MGVCAAVHQSFLCEPGSDGRPNRDSWLSKRHRGTCRLPRHRQRDQKTTTGARHPTGFTYAGGYRLLSARPADHLPGDPRNCFFSVTRWGRDHACFRCDGCPCIPGSRDRLWQRPGLGIRGLDPGGAHLRLAHRTFWFPGRVPGGEPDVAHGRALYPGHTSALLRETTNCWAASIQFANGISANHPRPHSPWLRHRHGLHRLS